MRTEAILEIIKEKDIFDFDDLREELGESAYNLLIEVCNEDTNPRRDYLGYRTFIQNDFDNRIFYIECVKYLHGNEYHTSGEAEIVSKPTYQPKQ